MKRAPIQYDPNLKTALNVSPPDSFLSNGADDIPSKNFIVSRKRCGSTASVYSDFSWDFTAYHARGYERKLSFIHWCGDDPSPEQQKIISEMQWLMFVLIWKRKGAPLSISSLQKYLYLLSSLARFSYQCSNTIRNALTIPIELKRYINEASSQNIKTLSSLLGILMTLEEKVLGFRALNGRSVKELHERGKAYDALIMQCAPLPTRIYSKLISGLVNELSEFEAISNNYVKMVVDCEADPFLARSHSGQHKVASRHGLSLDKTNYRSDFETVTEQYGLTSYFQAKGITNFVSVPRCLTEIQIICKLLIHVYSGMRDDEARSLPYHCLKEFKQNGKTHFQIVGSTTKLNNGSIKRTKWVTSREAVQAIRVAQKVAQSIYRVIGDTPTDLQEENDAYPLFVSVAYLPSQSITPSLTSAKYATSTSTLSSNTAKRLITRLKLVISEKDVCELEKIDPHRAWRTEQKFKIGENWPLKTHQLRRSLALYASSSGLVSLPSLRRQLQHITEEMSQYYAAGSSFAKNIIQDDNEHFGTEYQNAQPESQALSFIGNVLFSDERLFGAYGTFAENNLIKASDMPIIGIDREKTVRKFQKGEMAYRNTALGGCTEIKACNKKAMRSIVTCLECSRAVIKLSKLEQAIRSQELLLSKIQEHTMEWHSEKSDLDIFRAAKLKFDCKQDRSLSDGKRT